MGRDRIIEDYIQRLSNSKEPFTADTLSKLAKEVGLEPDDIAAVKQQSQAHLEHGRDYFYFNCLDEAIDELTQAITLDPLNFEGLQTLAYVYDQRYGKQKNSADKNQALALAKRCRELRPDDKDAVALISSLEHEADNRHRLIWLALAPVVMIVGFIAMVNLMSTRSQVEQLTQDGVPTDLAPADRETNSQADGDPASAMEIPITFEQVDLTLEPRQSRLDNYKESSYYTLQGVLLNTGKQDIEALQLQVEYLDKDGVVIATENKDAIAQEDATVRPGDTHAFDLIYKTTSDLAEVRLSATTLDQVLAPDNYEQAIPLDYTWDAQKPAQLDFDLVIRNENLTVYDIDNTAYFDAEWAITNTGNTAIRQLKLKTEFYNAQGSLILSEEVLAVYGSDASILPGEVRPVQVVETISKDFLRYEVTVVEAQ